MFVFPDFYGMKLKTREGLQRLIVRICNRYNIIEPSQLDGKTYQELFDELVLINRQIMRKNDLLDNINWN